MSTEIDYDATTRNGRDALRSEIRTAWDGGDPWGSVLSALGGTCDMLWFHGGDIPESTGYSPALCQSIDDYPAAMFDEMHDAGHIRLGDLEYWTRVLDRFADLVPEDRRY